MIYPPITFTHYRLNLHFLYSNDFSLFKADRLSLEDFAVREQVREYYSFRTRFLRPFFIYSSDTLYYQDPRARAVELSLPLPQNNNFGLVYSFFTFVHTDEPDLGGLPFDNF